MNRNINETLCKNASVFYIFTVRTSWEWAKLYHWTRVEEHLPWQFQIISVKPTSRSASILWVLNCVNTFPIRKCYSIVFEVTIIFQMQQAAEGVDLASRETYHFTWLSWIWIMSIKWSEGAIQGKFDRLQLWPHLWSASRHCLICSILKFHSHSL